VCVCDWVGHSGRGCMEMITVVILGILGETCCLSVPFFKHVENSFVRLINTMIHMKHFFSYHCLGLFRYVAQLDSSIRARDAFECAYAAVPRYTLRRAGDDHPDVPGRLGCTRLVMLPQPPSAKSGTLQSDMDIPGE